MSFEEKIENILNAQPIKYYPNKEDAQRVLRERNARLAGQISQLFEQVKRDIFNKTVQAAEHRERFVIEQVKQETAKEIEEIADLEGGMHTFKRKSVEDCILIKKQDWQSLKARYGVK